MLCGLTRLASRIKMCWYVMTHKEYKCKPHCLWCKYFDVCYDVKENIETVFGEPLE